MIFKKSFTKPMPGGAETFTRGGKPWARWIDGAGKKRTARVSVGADGTPHILCEVSTWYVRYRKADGLVVTEPTGCRDKSAAASRLAELRAEQDKIRAGIITASEVETAKHGGMAYATAVDAFIQDMEARDCAKTTRTDWRQYLESAGVKGLGWRTLRDMGRAELERWLSMRAVTPKDPKKPDSLMGARVHNAFVTAFTSFGAWCARHGYVKVNPFTDTVKRDERADRRHIRRALTADELGKLIEAAAARPVADALKGNKGRGEKMEAAAATVSDKRLEAAAWRGRVRAMAYWTAAGTGLRWAELRSITLGAVRLDAEIPHLILQAKDEKARRGAQIALESDLAAGLRAYVAELRSRRIGHSGASIVAFPGAFDAVPLFDVPKKMSRVFAADCAAAGIAKRDGAGRVVDVHALRHTFGTMLARAGVSLQLVQKAMRHSTPVLTTGVYLHLGLEDLAGAVECLPTVKKDSPLASQLASQLASFSGKPGASESNPGNSTCSSGGVGCPETDTRISNIGKGFQGVSGEMSGGRCKTRTCDTLRVRQDAKICKGCHDNDLQEGHPAACTCACTRNGNPVQVDALIATLAGLSPEDKERVILALLGK